MGKNHKKIIIAASGAVAMALSLCACQVGGSTSAPAESKAASDTITMMNSPIGSEKTRLQPSKTKPDTR